MTADDVLLDASGVPIATTNSIRTQAIDAASIQEASGNLVQSLNDIDRMRSTAISNVATVQSLFDGTRSVRVGKMEAPVGLVVVGGLLALLAFNKDR